MPQHLLHCDNQGLIRLAKNPIFHSRTKHIESKHHFLCERVLEGEIQLHHISTNDNPTNILTKQVKRDTFQKHRHFIGLREAPPDTTGTTCQDSMRANTTL